MITSDHTRSIQNAVRTIRKLKLNAEKDAIYRPVLPGLRVLYCLSVIRLASDAISVPTPPMLTPSKRL